MSRLLAAVCAPMALVTALASPVSADLSAAVVERCEKYVEITGGKVAVRDQPSANAPIVRFVKRGDVLASCWKSIGRGDAYDKCGAEHYDWYLVGAGAPKSGYVPVTCARAL